LRPTAVFLVLFGLLAFMPGLLALTERAGAATRLDVVREHGLLRQIGHYRKVTWHWQRVMNVRLTRTEFSARRRPSHEYRRWVRDLWKRRSVRAKRKAHNPPHLAAWLCLHRYEGSWADGGAPYYGGLQMDLRFQLTYGRELFRRKGTADNWTPLEQMWVAERAMRSGRGFYPWPHSARMCGLI
jgi:hypothetical protein